MCVALLYSVCVCVCVRVRETLLLVAFHVGLCSVLTLYKQIHRDTLCTPEGLISPVWKAVVALNCVFHARKHPDSSALSQRESSMAGWACLWAALCPGVAVVFPGPGGKGWHADLVAQL